MNNKYPSSFKYLKESSTKKGYKGLEDNFDSEKIHNDVLNPTPWKTNNSQICLLM